MSNPLEALLRQSNLLPERQLQRSIEQARRRNVPLIDVVLREDGVPEDSLADAFASWLKVPRVRLASATIESEAVNKLTEKIARKHTVMPVQIEGRTLVLAMANPLDYAAIQDIEFYTSLSVKTVVASGSEITDAIDERYDPEDRLGAFLANVPEVTDLQIMPADAQDSEVDVAHSRSAAEITPVVKMCNLLISDAIKLGASDLHIEPALNDVQVRVRVDGVLRDYTHLPKWLHNPLVSRLKILAKLDIAERRLPQDGRVNLQYQGKALDLRISTLPMHFGEKVVLRVLGAGVLPTLGKLGLADATRQLLENAVDQPQGMILVTGPTGSGKTTTLYAMLTHRRSPEVNIVTIEDPIEYQLSGINQVQVNTRAGLTFAGVLRSILRQDPDVILVGETRDQETAEVAFQAAMTGHLVLSTLHTNSAIATITRLYDLGVDANILATSLSLVVAQRLVRRICDQCREQVEADHPTLERLGLPTTESFTMYRGRGCQACGHTGYNGRVALYEFLRPTRAMRKLIHQRASEAELRRAVRQARIPLLRDDAIDKIRHGITTADEVLRVVQIEEEEVPCPNCHVLIQANFSTCPYCLHSLKTLCASCGQELKLGWKICPYCNTHTAVQPLAASLDADRGLLTAPSTTTPGIQPPPAPDRRAAPAPQWNPGFQEFDFSAVPARVGAADALVAHPVSPEPDPGDVLVPAPGPGPGTPAAPRAAGASEGRRSPEVPAPPPVEATRPGIPAGAATAPAVDAPAAPDGGMPAEPAIPTADKTPLTPATGVETAAPRKRLRVLVVDDDKDIVKVIALTLRRLPVEIDVDVAEDGVVALEKAIAHPPDLVILDIMMPRLNGFDTCRGLRQDFRTTFVPILMLTASGDEASRTKGYLVGTDDYMGKPFLPIDLNLRVKRLLRRTYGI